MEQHQRCQHLQTGSASGGVLAHEQYSQAKHEKQWKKQWEECSQTSQSQSDCAAQKALTSRLDNSNFKPQLGAQCKHIGVSSAYVNFGLLQA